jgi:hypothetical protein
MECLATSDGALSVTFPGASVTEIWSTDQVELG